MQSPGFYRIINDKGPSGDVCRAHLYAGGTIIQEISVRGWTLKGERSCLHFQAIIWNLTIRGSGELTTRFGIDAPSYPGLRSDCNYSKIRELRAPFDPGGQRRRT